MIHVVLGTKAQLIKMAPIMRRMKDRDIEYNYISTGQHHDTMAEILDNFQIKRPDVHLYNGPDITSITQMFLWAIKILFKTLFNRQKIFKGDKNGIVLVHGDTFSTLLGALMGRVAGLKVGHVESGLRSFNIFKPFPEELTRIGTFYLSHFYFCPGEWAQNNLKKFSGKKIDTNMNTLIDSLFYAKPMITKTVKGLIPDYSYGIVTVHRYENVFNQESIKKVVEAVQLIAKKHKLLFILHKPTKINLEKFGCYETLASDPNIELRPRYDYFDFMRLLNHAEFVVSDGGSNQEECFYFGKPLILLRDVTERHEGLGQNAVLSKFNHDTIKKFSENYSTYARAPFQPKISPTDIILDGCAQFS